MRLLGVLLLCCLAVQSALAAEIQLRDGTTYSNVTILQRDAENIQIQMPYGEIRIPLASVKSIDGVPVGQTISPRPALAEPNGGAPTSAVNAPEAKAAKAAADLASLQKQRAKLIKDLANARDFLEHAKSTLAKTALAKGQIISHDDKHRVISGAPSAKVTREIEIWTETELQRAKMSGHVIVPNPDRPKSEESVSFYTRQVSAGEAALAELDKRISQFPTVGASDDRHGTTTATTHRSRPRSPKPRLSASRHEIPTAATPNPLFAAPPPAAQPPAAPIRPKPAVVSTEDTTSEDTSSATTGFKLVKAVWGADPTWVDVTAHVQSLIAAGTTSINANGIVFGDPIPGRGKTLKITYTLRGKQVTESIREWESYKVPTPDAPIRPQ